MLKYKSSLILLVFAGLLFSSCAKKQDSDTGYEQNLAYDYPEIEIEDESFEIIENEKDAYLANNENNLEEDIVEEEVVEVQDRVYFDVDSTTLSSEAKSILDTQVEWLNSEIDVSILIEGHCDERGTREYNIALGEKRAVAVKNYLISKSVDKSRISTISYGKERPAFIGSSEDVWKKNRRAVTTVVEK